MRSDDRLRRIERATDGPLLGLAIALIPLLLVPAVADPSPAVGRAILAADWLIWGAFAAVFLAKLAVAPARWRFLRTHWLEALMVALPMLRPLRVLRVLRLMRVATCSG
jgi:voltage-gated potassium channel